MLDKETSLDVSVFLAASVHDMKNSISMLIGSLEQVAEAVDPATFPAARQIGQMFYETQRINGNLLQLLTLYKLDKDRYPFNREYIELDEFVQELVGQSWRLLEARKIRLELQTEAGLYWEFDRDLLAGVLNHALNNAIQYTGDAVRLVVTAQTGQLEIRVEDNGSGFPQQMLDDAAAAMSGAEFNPGSTGIGLYFSAIVARLHRNRNPERSGEIVLENGGGEWRGGCFIVRLP